MNDQEPGVRGPRFLWWAWPLAELRSATCHDGTTTLSARLLDARSKRPVAERRVTVSPRSVRVEDRHALAQPATLQVTWLIHTDAPATVTAAGALTQDLTATEGETAGWFSPTYGVKVAAMALRLRAEGIDRETPVVTQIEFGETSQ